MGEEALDRNEGGGDEGVIMDRSVGGTSLSSLETYTRDSSDCHVYCYGGN